MSRTQHSGRTSIHLLRLASIIVTAAAIVVGAVLIESATASTSAYTVTSPSLAAALGTGVAVINDVSCASAVDCVAVGSFTSSVTNSGASLLVGVESSGTWTPFTVPSLGFTAPAGSSRITSPLVDCPSVGNCTIIGNDQISNGAVLTSMLVTLDETNGTWGEVQQLTLPVGTAADGAGLNALSCSSAGNCASVGSDNYNSNLAVNEVNGVWQTGVALVAPSSPLISMNPSLASVDCASDGNCTAVGEGQLVSEVNGVWGGVQVLPVTGETMTVTGLATSSISCPVANDCVVVGSIALVGSPPNAAADTTYAFVDQESSGVWSTQALPLAPSSALADAFTSVACPAVGDCVAVGDFTPSKGGPDYLLGGLSATSSNGVWTLQNSAAGYYNSVACAGVGNCVIAGGIDRLALDAGPSYATYTPIVNGVFAPQAATFTYVKGSLVIPYGNVSASCPTVLMCTVVGDGLGQIFVASTATPTVETTTTVAPAKRVGIPMVEKVTPAKRSALVKIKMPSGGGTPTGYQYSINNGRTFSKPVNATTLKITGLVPKHRYVAVVRAVNSVGAGTFSKRFAFKTT